MMGISPPLAPITRPPGSLGGLFAAGLYSAVALTVAFATSADWSDDATGWNAGQLALVAELSGDHVTIRPGRPADYATLLVACLAGGRLPGPVIDHWALDGEDAPVLVNDDQEERSCRFVFVHRDRLAATTAFGATRGAAADAAATLLSTHLGRLVAERSVPKAVVGRQGSRTIQRPSEAHSSMPWKRA